MVVFCPRSSKITTLLRPIQQVRVLFDLAPSLFGDSLILSTTQASSVVPMIWTSLVNRDFVWFLIGFSNLLTFGCGGWNSELHLLKFGIRLRFNSPSKCLCLVYNFEVLNLDVSMSLFVFLSPSFSAMESHFPLVFLVGVSQT